MRGISNQFTVAQWKKLWDSNRTMHQGQWFELWQKGKTYCKRKIVTGVAVIVLGVWLMYTRMEIGVRIIGKEGKGER